MRADDDHWYQSLQKSSLTPPGEIFGVGGPLCNPCAGWLAIVATACCVQPSFALSLCDSNGDELVFFIFHCFNLAFALLVVMVAINFVLLYQLSRVPLYIFPIGFGWASLPI